MDDRIILRPWQEHDDPVALTDLLHQSYAVWIERGQRFTATYQTVETTRYRLANGFTTLAVLDALYIGTITAYPPSPNDRVPYYRRERTWTFGQFGIHPDFKGQGIGRRLFTAVETLARENGAQELACDTSENATDLIEMYQRWGMRIVDTYNWQDTNYLSIILAKPL